MGLIFFLSAQPDLPHPRSHWLGELLGNLAHFGLYAILAVLWARALLATSDRRATARPLLWLAFTLTALYALSDEIHQSFVPGRVADVRDLGLDLLGAVVGLWLWAKMRKRHGRPSAQK
jgi:VanZ family protein